MKTFEEIRLRALDLWYKGLDRNRNENSLTDDYSESKWCSIQDECTSNGKHCSFICSLGDWMDNVSDLLHDTRFDKLSREDYPAVFRFYTRILLIISEILEDFVNLNAQIQGLASKPASRDLEKDILHDKELKDISDFINTVCKHKSESDNLHVHNHHLLIEFVDFDDPEDENQIRLGKLKLDEFNSDTSILMPSLIYFINVVIIVKNKLLGLINQRPELKSKLLEIYADEWHSQ